MGRDAVHNGLPFIDTGSEFREIEDPDLTVVASDHELAAVGGETDRHAAERADAPKKVPAGQIEYPDAWIAVRPLLLVTTYPRSGEKTPKKMS